MYVYIMLNGDPVVMDLLLGFSIASVFQSKKQPLSTSHLLDTHYTYCATAQWFEVSLVLGCVLGCRFEPLPAELSW